MTSSISLNLYCFRKMLQFRNLFNNCTCTNLHLPPLCSCIMMKPLIISEHILLFLQVSQLNAQREWGTLGKPLNTFPPAAPCICTEYNLAACFKTLLGNKTIGFLTPSVTKPCTLHRHTQIPFHKSAVTSEQAWIYFIEGGTEAGRTGSKEQFNFWHLRVRTPYFIFLFSRFLSVHSTALSGFGCS